MGEAVTATPTLTQAILLPGENILLQPAEQPPCTSGGVNGLAGTGVGGGEGGEEGGDVVGGVRQWSCTMCLEAYTTFTGMRLHQKRAHVEEFNRERLTVGMAKTSTRWGQQEMLLFAMAEASLVIGGYRLRRLIMGWH